MDADLEATEIVLAQKLASGEPTIRRRALKALQDWLRNESVTTKFNERSMERLCKGLHYVMWMQDKMLLQEELADNISNLMNIFCDDAQSVLYVKYLFIVFSQEWSRIDRWRMDKFLMLIRRIVRAVFTRLRQNNWQSSVTEMYMEAFKETVISSDKSFSEGLKYHFASVYLDELDNAGGLTPEQVTGFLEPYANILSVNGITTYFFDSVVEEIFVAILHFYAEEKAAAEEKEGDEEILEEASSSEGLKFDFIGISNMLFDIGKRPGIKSIRRKRLYAIVQKFKAAAAGEDPFVTVTTADVGLKAVVPKEDIQAAVADVLNEHAKDVAAKLKAKKKLKESRRKREGQFEEAVPTAALSEETPITKKKKQQKKKRTSTSKKTRGLRPKKGKKVVKGRK